MATIITSVWMRTRALKPISSGLLRVDCSSLAGHLRILQMIPSSLILSELSRIITTHEFWVIWRQEVTAIPTSSMPSTTSALVQEGSLLKLTEFYETKCLESRQLLCMWDEFHMRSTKLKELLKRKNKEHHLKVYHQLDHCGGEDSRPKQEHYSPP